MSVIPTQTVCDSPSSMNTTEISASFDNLSAVATVFASLSALFGCYFVLFIIAIWATYRQGSIASYRLRMVTILLFIVLCTHYTARAVGFSHARLSIQPANEELAWEIPIIFVGSITTTFAGLIADGLLAWRFYVIYGQARWALYIPATAVIINALLGLSAGFQHLSIYKNMGQYTGHLEVVSFQITAAWGWFMFITNTLLTGSIIGKIIHVSRETSSQVIQQGHYSTVIAAIAESALVTWVGLLLYGIASVAPQGHITTNLDVGYVMLCVVPIFFGISQCLIIVHVGLSKTTSVYSAKLSDRGLVGNGDGSADEFFLKIQQEVRVDAGSIEEAAVPSLKELGMNLQSEKHTDTT